MSIAMVSQWMFQWQCKSRPAGLGALFISFQATPEAGQRLLATVWMFRYVAAKP